MTKVALDMPKVMKNVELQVTLTGTTKAVCRIAIGTKLLKLAAKVLGCKLEINTPPGGQISGR